MNLTVNREALLSACRLAARLLPERAVRPNEAYLLLRAADDVCELHAATGHDASLRLPLTARVSAAGEALLAARDGLAVLRSSPAEEVAVEFSGDALVLRWPGARCRLESPPAA